MSKYLDQDGVLYFWQKLKALLGNKVDKVSGKGLSTNDYTTTEKNKLAGIADSANNYILPTASSSTKGGVKVGDGLSIDSEGVLSAGAYALPTASSTTKGGVKIGSGLTMTGEVLSADVQSVDVMTGATSTTDGVSGLVPAPASGKESSFLRGDGKWETPLNTDQFFKVKDITTLLAYGSAEYPLIAADIDYGSLTYTTSYMGTVPESTANRPRINNAGTLIAKSFKGIGSEITSLNASNISSGTIGSARLPVATASAQGAMSAAHYSKLEALPTASELETSFSEKASTSTATQSANGLMSSSDKTKLDAFGAASTYALKTDITSMYKHKGSVSTTNDLPSTGNTEGDVYNVTATGMNYVWVVTSGTGAWDALGEVFTIDSITNSEIDTILAS